MKLLSIIIPVYNTEKWIARCLDSCIKQDILRSEYEIIIIDDETPDDAISIAERYAYTYNNIRIIKQKNGGASIARNRGIQEATGEYIWFIDSDDFIVENCLSNLINIIKSDNLDILCFGLQLVFENGDKELFPIITNCANQIVKGPLFTSEVPMPPSAWPAIFKRSFITENELTFFPKIIHEDFEFVSRAYWLANKVKYVDKIVYNYFQRNGSVMKSNNSKRADDLLIVSDSLFDFIKKHNITETCIEYNTMRNKVSFAYAQSLAFCSKLDKSTILKYKNKPYYPLAINNLLSKKEKIKYRVINLSIGAYLFIYRVFK